MDTTAVTDCLTRIDLPEPGRSAEENRCAAPACFVAGPENRLVAATVQQLLNEESQTLSGINPLFLFGPTGSGKSLLARGITRRWNQNFGKQRPEATKVAYVTAADFGRQLHDARANDSLAELRKRLAQLRLLVVEDLQHLSPRDFVQRELRDTIDTMIEAGGLVVLTAQQSPATCSVLERGLSDRLQAGLAIQLRPPGVEARQEILTLAANARQLLLPADRLQQLAQQIEGPAPRLFQALTKLELASHGQSPPPLPKEKMLSFKQILAIVARDYSVSQVALCSPSRRQSLVHARGVAIHLARTLTDLSYTQIGQALGRRDHSTITHAYRKINHLLADDPDTQQTIDHLHRLLTAV